MAKIILVLRGICIKNLMCLAILVLILSANTRANVFAAPPPTSYPLKVSGDHRYVVDQNDNPFLIVGDSPQGLIADLSTADAATYFANRASYGFNAVQIHLLAGATFGGRSDLSTYDGITPFTTNGDISTPRDSYFARVDAILNLAAQNGIVVFLTAAETIDSLTLFKNNGTTKCRTFGQYLGNRYKSFPNIVWDYGNDLQTWRISSDNAVILAVADGIKDTDPNHLHTVWLDYLRSASRDSSDWDNRIDVDFVYTYYDTYDKTLTEYALSPAKPLYLGESNYEEESLRGYLTTPNIVRRQEYWVMTSGACGSFYGNYWTWPFRSGWQSHYNSTGAAEMVYYKNLFLSRPWWNLAPDPNHQVLTAGFGTYDSGEAMNTNDYATAALSSDSSFLIIYLPTSRQITINMSKISGSQSHAWWYNPSTGSAVSIGIFSNTGSANFTPPIGDWIFVLDDTSKLYPPPGTPLLAEKTALDFDGDAKADIAVRRGSSGMWYILPSNSKGNYRSTQWGQSDDIAVPGDYDGDGITDIAVWRPSSGVWYVLPSASPGIYTLTNWGIQGDRPFPADYDGDGKTDIAIWRPSSCIWYTLLSGSPGGYTAAQWGLSTDIATPGDYDGDGKSDIAVWRPNNGVWYILTSRSPGTYTATQWGQLTDIPVPGDYDGDGMVDIAVWRGDTGIWYIRPSSAPGTYTSTQWGLFTDTPVPEDYDGDRRVDIAVWRASNGLWYRLPSNSPGTYTTTQWGMSSDLPISPLTAMLYLIER